MPYGDITLDQFLAEMDWAVGPPANPKAFDQQPGSPRGFGIPRPADLTSKAQLADLGEDWDMFGEDIDTYGIDGPDDYNLYGFGDLGEIDGMFDGVKKWAGKVGKYVGVAIVLGGIVILLPKAMTSINTVKAYKRIADNRKMMRGGQ